MIDFNSRPTVVTGVISTLATIGIITGMVVFGGKVIEQEKANYRDRLQRQEALVTPYRFEIDGTPFQARLKGSNLVIRQPDTIVERQWADSEPYGTLDSYAYVGGVGRGVIAGVIIEGDNGFDEQSEFYRTQIFPQVKHLVEQ